jgi:hypothetical protein
MNTLTIHNIFGHGYTQADLNRLQKLGFIIRPQGSSFAGSQELRFIDFRTGPCLELIEVTDPEDYLNFVPPGMLPYQPGLNLALEEGTEQQLAGLAEQFAGWGPYLLHENYEGGQNKQKPGWNYLNFRDPVLPGTFVFLTEFEKPYPASHPRTIHANTATRVSGLVFDLDAGQMVRLSQLTGQPLEDGLLRLDGIPLYSREAAPLPARSSGPLAPEKDFSLTAVLLEAESLAPFRGADPSLEEAACAGRPALRIPTPARSWDLVVHV